VRRARHAGAVLAVVAAAAVAALTGAHALFRALHGGSGVWTGGLASTGGIAAGLLAAAAVARLAGRPVIEVLDALAPAGLLALGIGRLGCFLGGCCYGAPTVLPWGVVFPDLGPPARHPLQLYSAAGDLALVPLVAAGAARGAATRRACLGFGLLRAALELLRDPGTTDMLPGGLVTLPQAAALLLAAGAAIAAARLRLR
jgi:phosphatidylglycerol:prolipoprotein diacylglycerol transferase